MSKTEKLVAALEKGEELSTAQIRARYGIQNVSSTIDRLRQQHGLCIYGNTKSGRNTVVYRIGTPTHELVAAGFQARALGL